MFNTKTEEWSQGPTMKEKRMVHSCFYDGHTNSIFAVGGKNHEDLDSFGGAVNQLASTEQWKLDTNQWISTPSLPGPLSHSAGVASKSMEYIGFIAGGYTNYNYTKKVLRLRRRNLVWEVAPQQLKKARRDHSIVNLPYDQIHGC